MRKGYGSGVWIKGMDHAVPQGMDQGMDRGIWIACGFGALIHTLYFDSYPYDHIYINLVGGFNPSEKYEFVNSLYVEKEIFQTTNRCNRIFNKGDGLLLCLLEFHENVLFFRNRSGMDRFRHAPWKSSQKHGAATMAEAETMAAAAARINGSMDAVQHRSAGAVCS